MKKIMLNGLLAASFCFYMASCDSPNNRTSDAAEIAEERNEERIDDGTTATKSEDDAEFMVKAASGGLMEVELGRIALQKASSQQVKDFARQMIDDHTKANEELKALAAQKNIVIPSMPGDDHQKHIDDLSKYSGVEFDKEYMDMMNKDHKEDIDLFEDAAEDAKDADVKTFAAKTLPVLKSHHQMAEKVKEATDKQDNSTARTMSSK